MMSLLLSGFFLSAQVVNVPEKSKKHFFAKYPGATNVDWTNSVAWYTAKFTDKDGTREVHYKLDGTWDYTELDMPKASFPAPVQTSVEKSRYAGWEMKSTAYVENRKAEKLYRVEWKKGIEKKYVYYDGTGREIRSSSSL
ncbi:hypothetical protein FPE01S_01_00510 [Flavihumibacter petaseus NBRC 106054]|uniref:Uncharacterized protein n=2 Tax=Flavihumibacter TaxID=1004301 RepID=A0A0E9MTZ5_9BACT|nr:hypothetical protein FPE01S_01_00510 [Flavihumibacter petaseus NBRC 106054]